VSEREVQMELVKLRKRIEELDARLAAVEKSDRDRAQFRARRG
jgi:hypothetical protein